MIAVELSDQMAHDAYRWLNANYSAHMARIHEVPCYRTWSRNGVVERSTRSTIWYSPPDIKAVALLFKLTFGGA